jgi:hypothetical protein
MLSFVYFGISVIDVNDFSMPSPIGHQFGIFSSVKVIRN